MIPVNPRHDLEAKGPWFELRQRQQMTTLAEGGLSRRDRATYDEAAARWSLKIRPIEVPPDQQHQPAPSDEQLAQHNTATPGKTHSRKARESSASAEDTRRGREKNIHTHDLTTSYTVQCPDCTRTHVCTVQYFAPIIRSHSLCIESSRKGHVK